MSHGNFYHPLYQAFYAAKDRCCNEKNYSYKNYGGRGIKFLFNSFEEFCLELEDTHKPGLSLDRKNNAGHYEKGNVRWATVQEQARNRRSNVLIEFNGVVKTRAEWSEYFNIHYYTLRDRIKNNGIDVVFSKLEAEKKKRDLIHA